MLRERKTKQQSPGKSHSIFLRILMPLCILVVLDAFLLIMVLQAAGVLRQLNQNSFDLFKKQVDNRQSFLSNQMTRRWMQLDELSQQINRRTLALADAGKLDINHLDSSPKDSSVLILDIVDSLIAELYSKQVSGIYVAFNTQDLQADAEAGNYQEKTGIYIRDNDPLSAASDKYADLLLECAPVSVVQSLSLSTDSNWEQRFKFSEERPYESWLTEPYTVASQTGLSASDCGLWSIRHDAGGQAALSYTIPLILPQSRVYGVLGVELLPSYLSNQMPTAELDEKGVYGLLMTEDSLAEGLSGGTLCMVNDRSGLFQAGDQLEFSPSKCGGYTIGRGNTEFTLSLTGLTLYNRNAPFENQHWYVLGAVPTNSLFAFTSQVKTMLLITVLLMLSFGTYGAFYASWHISRPITALRRELEDSWDKGVPHLSATGISEVDDFAEQITSLSRDVVNSSRRFLSIMEMSSIDMGGYELDESSGFLFVTDNFFPLFGMEAHIAQGMTPEQFRQRMDAILSSVDTEPASGGGYICAISQSGGNPRYIHIQETRVETRRIGVAEDVTTQILERKRIEHERDYDLLTGICNRRAFYRTGAQLLCDREQLGVAVAVMVDLDNLKSMNDTYGHEWGDRYIMAGAQCIQQNVSEHSLIARVSGDEFSLLLYGFESQTEAREAVYRLQRGFQESCFVLPDGRMKPVGASGGFCFAEQACWDLKELMKHADFAMYTVKHTTKGAFGEFNPDEYQSSEIHQKKVRAFKRVLEEVNIRYVYQPIVDARTGKLFACEALLRVLDGDIANTEEFLRIARSENKLDVIEHLTWYHALSGFQHLLDIQAVPRDAKIFINSQVSRLLNPEEQQMLIRQFGSIRQNTVMEIVETDDAPLRLNQLQNRELELFAQEFALDDFGTGYNNEKNLLELMPQYLKLDMALVRNVHKHADRQLLIKGLITFAHQQNILVLAEGVETLQELGCLLDLQVDLLQGFLLARPTEIPGEINPEAVKRIQSFSCQAVF